MGGPGGSRWVWAQEGEGGQQRICSETRNRCILHTTKHQLGLVVLGNSWHGQLIALLAMLVMWA